MYFLYILECNDKSLYTGITNDLDKRLSTHLNGKGSKYVRSRLPFELKYTEEFETKSEALKREIFIKSLNRDQKINLLNKAGY